MRDLATQMRLFNTLAGKIRELEPLTDPVGMYVCGPTTYAPTHLGHAKSYLTFDILRRWLEFNGHRVRHVQNITDVADETAEQALTERREELELAQAHADEFTGQMLAMGNLPPHVMVNASTVVDRTARVAVRLLERGLAYGTDEGAVYLRARAEDFGKLLRADLERITETPRDQLRPLGGKGDPHDFLLWSPAPEGWRAWDSPLGPGRPGWHTECYVIASTELGLPFDIHGGGEDLIFPHHESEALLAHHLEDSEYARQWVHHGLIFDEGGKLSKSRGRHTTLADIFEDCPPHALRFYLLQDHYRQATRFDPERLEAACAEGQRLSQTADRVLNLCPEPAMASMDRDEEVLYLKGEMEAALNDDLHTDRAVAILRQLDTLASEALVDMNRELLEAIAALYRCFQQVLGLFPDINKKERDG